MKTNIDHTEKGHSMPDKILLPIVRSQKQFNLFKQNQLQLNKMQLVSTQASKANNQAYSHPKFTFNEQVVEAKQLDNYLLEKIPLKENLTIFEILGIRLIEMGETCDWLYGLRSEFGTSELIWVSEDELVSLSEALTSEEF